jgi:hypothetical protein
MVFVKKLKLDVLKPHVPNVLELARAIADQGRDYRVSIVVMEVDEKTETVEVLIESEDIQFENVADIIRSLGASLHSIDEVHVTNQPVPD